MPPDPHFVPRFAAEPPQEGLPYGRWAERLSAAFLAACERLTEEQEDEDLGSPGEISWHPDRTWNGITYVPATTLTSGGYEIFGCVCFPASRGGEPDDQPRGEPSDQPHDEPSDQPRDEPGEEESAEMRATADFTEETAERNPDWKLDICDEVIGSWRGEGNATAKMTLVWGRALIHGGRVATGELQDSTVDQCVLIEERFTLIAPDDYRDELLEIRLYDGKGRELASESLYAPDDEQS